MADMANAMPLRLVLSARSDHDAAKIVFSVYPAITG